MLPNFLKITLRNLRKSSTYSVLNVFGLSLGIVCAGLIFLWVEDETHYNQYFSNSAHIYTVKNQQSNNNSAIMVPYTPGPLAPAMQTDIPGIRHIARLSTNTKSLFSTGDKSVYEEGRFTDPSFFDLFRLQFVQGNSTTAFRQLQSVVISEKMAKTLFDNASAFGKTVIIGNKKEYVITGVLKDLPANVSLKFDYLLPYQDYESINPSLKYWGNQLFTWVELEPSAHLDAINRQLATFAHDKQPEITNEKMSLYPLSRLRLYNSFDKSGKETADGRIKYVHLFSIIGAIILLIACINFMNLATARSQKRAKEVGVRKVMGATRQGLINQFIGEAIILSFLATLLAIFLIYLVLPAFNHLVEKELVPDLFTPVHLFSLLAIALTCGLLAGSYPAFYLSSFNPTAVLKSEKQKEGSAGFIRKSLVVIQFAASVIFIICSFVIYQQITYTRQRDIGFNRQNLIYSGLQGNMKTHFDAIKNEMIRSGAVEDASLSIGNALEGGYSSDGFTWPGKAPDQQVLISYEMVTPEYIHTMGMQLQAGRDFHSNMLADSNHIIINETLARLIGEKNAVGSVIGAGTQHFTVLGVIKDFTFGNIFQSAAPIILFPDTVNASTMTIRLKANTDLQGNLSKVSAVLKATNPGYPFEYKFLDDEFNDNFKTESLTGKLAGLFSALAIIISCIGLFGLAAYTAERRTKEIGIRKVLGASVAGVTALLSKDFLRLVAISCIIAFPIAGWLMHNWLQSYQYRIELSAWLFAFTGLLVMLIALATVSFQAIRAAWANPVRSLRSE
jgi:putative ABC transport system permease protein